MHKPYIIIEKIFELPYAKKYYDIDLFMYGGGNAENQLIALLSEELAMEIDREILRMALGGFNV